MIGLISGTYFFTVCLGPVFTLFLLKIGAREKIIGMLSVLPSLTGITSLWMVKNVAGNPNISFIRSAWSMLAVEFCFMPLFLFANSIPHTAVLVMFSFLLCLFYFFMQQYVYAWFPVISSLIHDNERGYFLGILRISLTLTGYTLLQVCSKMLGLDPAYIRFFYVTLMIVVFSIPFPVCLSKARLPEVKKVSSQQINLIYEFITILKNKDLRTYFKYLSLWTFISGIIGPFLIPFYKTELHMSSSFCVVLASANTLGYGLSAFGWGKLADRYGSRYVLFVSCILAIFHLSVLMHIHLLPVDLVKMYAMVCSFLGGVVLAGQLMGDTTRRMALAPQERSFSYFAFMLVFGAQLPVLVASPVAGFLIQRYRHLRVGFYGIYQLVIFVTVFLYIVLLWQISRMRPLKEKPVMELLKNSLTESLMKIRDIIASPP